MTSNVVAGTLWLIEITNSAENMQLKQSDIHAYATNLPDMTEFTGPAYTSRFADAAQMQLRDA
jgi:hypothetical protein